MNELYGVSPDACPSAGELRLLLAAFGPAAGKYILAYPGFPVWRDHLLAAFTSAGDIERERIKTILMRAQQNHALLDRRNLTWHDHLDWARNALKVWATTGAEFKQIYFSDAAFEQLQASEAQAAMACAARVSDPAPFTPADGQIESSPQNYWNIAKILCSISSELHFVDPYLNPGKADRRRVLGKFVQELGKLSKTQSVFMWSRWDALANSQGKVDEKALEQALKDWVRDSNTSKKLSIQLNLVDDRTSSEKLHARYLLTEKGGIKFDQGFQELGAGRLNVVSPVGTDLHQNLYPKFAGKIFDFKLVKSIRVTT